MRRLLIVMAIVLTVATAAARACGACDDDKVAATYDHAVIDAATVRQQPVVFVAVDGPVNGERLARRLAAAANRIQGVQRGTLRTSTSPLAVSFVLARTRKPKAAVAEFRHAIGEAPARLALVRIMRNGELIDPRQETP